MKTFRLDRRHGKFLGVCAGISNYTGLDATIIRICAVVLTLVSGSAWPFLAYFAAAWIAGKQSKKHDAAIPEVRPAGGSVHALRPELSDTERKLAEVERYVASPNSRLAREIDALR